jgi:hypothetical protein
MLLARPLLRLHRNDVESGISSSLSQEQEGRRRTVQDVLLCNICGRRGLPVDVVEPKGTHRDQLADLRLVQGRKCVGVDVLVCIGEIRLDLETQHTPRRCWAVKRVAAHLAHSPDHTATMLHIVLLFLLAGQGGRAEEERLIGWRG